MDRFMIDWWLAVIKMTADFRGIDLRDSSTFNKRGK